nr:transposase [Enterococcus sp. RIT-PI-f]
MLSYRYELAYFQLTNGKIEAKNTHIKTMKRGSYGFKSFENMRI